MCGPRSCVGCFFLGVVSHSEGIIGMLIVEMPNDPVAASVPSYSGFFDESDSQLWYSSKLSRKMNAGWVTSRKPRMFRALRLFDLFLRRDDS